MMRRPKHAKKEVVTPKEEGEKKKKKKKCRLRQSVSGCSSNKSNFVVISFTSMCTFSTRRIQLCCKTVSL
jgi:hypothetical protein